MWTAAQTTDLAVRHQTSGATNGFQKPASGSPPNLVSGVQRVQPRGQPRHAPDRADDDDADADDHGGGRSALGSQETEAKIFGMSTRSSLLPEPTLALRSASPGMLSPHALCYRNTCDHYQRSNWLIPGQLLTEN